jgi:RimJ/RimL family protein N-acetyltransferase
VRLETERLVLRPLSTDDLNDLARWYADAEVMRYIGPGDAIDRDRSRQSLERMIASFEADGFGQLAVERKEDGAFIGRCGILVWDAETWTPTRASEAQGSVEIEVGYLLGPEFWGHGYATEAASAVRDWALENLRPKRLIALIQPGNDRSSGVARKLDMEPTGEVEIFGQRAVVYAVARRHL